MPGFSVSVTEASKTEAPLAASSDIFDKLVEDIKAATNSAEAVLDNKSCDSSMLLKARDELKSHEPALSKLSDIASARAQSGDAEGIDIVSMVSEEFNSVRYAIEDRIIEITAQAANGSEPVSTTGAAEKLPDTKLDEFNKLVGEIRAATAFAETLLDNDSSDTQTLQKALDKLKSHEPTLSKLSDMASARALMGDAELIDLLSSVSEEFNSVRYAIHDRWIARCTSSH